MQAIIIGGGMGGLFSALALRESGVFKRIDVYEQTREPSTAGAGLNVPPNGARLCHWLGVDLDGGETHAPHGALQGGRAAILEATRELKPDGSVSHNPLDHDTAAGDGAGFHHMHRMDLLMCLHQRVSEFAPDKVSDCPIAVHMGKRFSEFTQSNDGVTATFADGSTAEGDVLISAEGLNSKVVEQQWPNAPPRRWTGAICYRGLIPREKVATLTKPDGSPMDHNPIDSFSMDLRKRPHAIALTYWVRRGELLNVFLGYYNPDSTEFHEDWGDWFPIRHEEMFGQMSQAFEGDPRHDDVLALASGMVEPTKWGLYDRDALENWTEGRVALVGDAAHSMLPTFGQAAAQAFEDGAALYSCFRLHGTEVHSALLHYERVRHYRATRFQYQSKFLFRALEPEDTPERQKILKALNERDYPFYNHEKRAGSSDAWIYAHDAREVGDSLPLQKLGPWDFRDREASRAVRREVMTNLWSPAKPLGGERKITRAELAQHATFEDCWVIIRGKVYDISEWKDHHPGGPFIARMHAGKDATAEFGDFHSKRAVKHMELFCVGELAETEEEAKQEATKSL